VSAGAPTADAPSRARLRITAGGAPTGPQLAALTAALTALLEGERVASPDPTPAAYRSRWRRAALLEATDPPERVVADAGRAWGVG
jgi:hypothetical protein